MKTTMIALIAAIAVAIATVSHADEKKKTAIATFAGGCFWCMEPPYDDIKGVKRTTSGYTGGTTKNPSYEEVSDGKTGHAEAVEIEYDPAQVTYQQLLDVFWRNIDPTVTNRQFVDRGTQYRPEIFYHDEEQKRLAEASKKDVEKFFGKVEVQITPAGPFYAAEEYHQDFYMTNPEHYNAYKNGSGRERRLKELWGDKAKK
ncbi:MAG TPA: peptide-methionine (S)-S-oxide reductase MsrA [Candidatus Krumholzibacteria bacterium]|nr:peptide-methionine (S)-S-oxide reductase MsrA [Candidatus Krumholzibacteria bacterium]